MSDERFQARLKVGIEIHVQLATRTKLFCGCPIVHGAPPNTSVCPVCAGMPGVLPVMNKRAFEFAVRTALALNCQIARFAKWDRKSYYYPDLPKNYQISQYDLPLSANGYVDIPVGDGTQTKRIRIRRAHLEEDAGKNVHDFPDFTGIDLNRAGVPLLEIVSEPDINSVEEAGTYARQVHQLLRYIGVSEGNMQLGQMRFEPNINLEVTVDGATYQTPIFELKNLNSFRALERTIAWVADYQLSEFRRRFGSDEPFTLEALGKQNWGWRDDLDVAQFQRGKEEAHDYRYFPEPDLVPVVVDEAWLDELRKTIPELPTARRQRFEREYGLPAKDAATIVADRATADLFDEAIARGADPKTLGKQFISFWSMHANERQCTIAELGLDAPRMAELSKLVADRHVTPTAAATIAEAMLTSDKSPAQIAKEQGLEQMTDTGAVEALVDEAIAANPKAVADYKSGGKKSKKALGFLQGQVMQKSKGSAPPQLVRELLERKLAD